MAISYNIVKKLPLAQKTIVDITLDGSYPAGGYTLSNSGLGMLGTPTMVDSDVRTGEGIAPVWISSTNKLKFYKTGAGLSGVFAEIAAGDVSASVVVRAEVTGDVVV